MEEDNKIILLITKSLSEEASVKELDELQKWVESSKENKLVFQQYKNIWNSSGQSYQEKKIEIEKSLNLVKSKVDLGSPSPRLWQFWKNVAAVLLIPIIAGNILYYIIRQGNNTSSVEPVYNEIFAAFGTRSAITLSDGSSLWLNSGSSIRYPDRFTGNDRTVYLNGEAYFDVESDDERPFIVKTSLISVRATGTKFNVLGFDYFEEAEVTLVSGKVDISTIDETSRQKYELDASQHLLFNQADGTTSIKTVDTYKYISWIDGKLIFRDEPLSNVVKKIEQNFNVDIELRGKDIQNYTYRATFQDESFEEILKLLKTSAPIDYREVKREPLPDNTFPRKKVIIFQVEK